MADITNCWVEVGLCGALPWTNTNSYKSGALAHHDGRVWAAKTDIPTGQPAPGLVPGAWFPITGQITYITENKPTLVNSPGQNYGFTGPTYPDPTAVPPQTGDLIFSTATGEICYVTRDASGAYTDTVPVTASPASGAVAAAVGGVSSTGVSGTVGPTGPTGPTGPAGMTDPVVTQNLHAAVERISSQEDITNDLLGDTPSVYASASAYSAGDVVSYQGGLYLARGAVTGVEPGTDPAKWASMAIPDLLARIAALEATP